jgi:uncharacterized oxidoreductase
MSGGLTGGRSSHPGAPPAKGNNIVFLALDPAKFAGADHLLNETTSLTDFVRATPRTEGVERILLPGDPERLTLEKRSRDGIPLEQGHWDKLVERAQALGVTIPA